MVGSELKSIHAGRGIFGESASRISIHHRRSRIPRRAGGRCVVPGGWSGPSSLRTRAERHLREGVISHLEIRLLLEGLTSDDVLKALDGAALFEEVVQSRNLDEPADVVREDLVVDDPFCELIPFIHVPTVDADAPFAVLVHPSESAHNMTDRHT